MKNFLPLLLIVLAITSYSQSFVGITIGPSIPVSDYGDTGSSNEEAGYADTGFNLSIDGAYFFNDKIGIGSSLGIYGHAVDASTMANELANDLPGSVITVTADPYSITTFMVGPFLNLPISDKLNFNSKLLAGLFKGTSPELTVDVDGTAFTITEASAGTFSVLFGAGLDYLISDKVSLGFMVDFTSAKPEFEYDFGAGTEKVEQQMSILNFGVNLKFRPFN